MNTAPNSSQRYFVSAAGRVPVAKFMPSFAEPFDGVLTEKEWTKARDKTGLTGGLTEKVSMGKELTLFHKTKDEPAAAHLLGKIGIYEQVLKAKHSKDKYFAKLLKLVTEQEAVQLGINILKNAPIIADVRKRLQEITRGAGRGQSNQGFHPDQNGGNRIPAAVRRAYVARERTAESSAGGSLHPEPHHGGSGGEPGEGLAAVSDRSREAADDNDDEAERRRGRQR